MLKENGSEYSLLEKIYNALFYWVLEYIHQLSMLSHIKYRNSNFTRIDNILILSRHPNAINRIALNIICQKKYTMPYSTFFLEYIHQLHMLSHLKDRNSNLTESKKSKYLLGTPMLKTKLLWIYSIRKNIQCPILLCFGVYTPRQYALSCKI